MVHSNCSPKKEIAHVHLWQKDYKPGKTADIEQIYITNRRYVTNPPLLPPSSPLYFIPLLPRDLVVSLLVNKKIGNFAEMEMVDILRTSTSWLRIAQFKDMELLERAIEEVSDKLLVNPEIILFGKTAHQHRCVGFFSNDTIGYQYSGNIAPSQSLTPYLTDLLTEVNQIFESNYNGILVNFFSNGSDYIGAHSDDERSLGPIGVISLSYGTTRKFRIRDRSTREIVMDVPVPSGALLHMGGAFQKEFTHEVPMEKRIREGRYSFTFRQHLS